MSLVTLSVWLVEFDQVIGSGRVAREGAAPSLTHVPVDARVAEHVPVRKTGKCDHKNCVKRLTTLLFLKLRTCMIKSLKFNAYVNSPLMLQT